MDVPRHIYRHAEDRSSRLEATDKLALLYAEQLRASGWVGSMTVPQQIFGLMPLRHSPSLERCVEAAATLAPLGP